MGGMPVRGVAVVGVGGVGGVRGVAVVGMGGVGGVRGVVVVGWVTVSGYGERGWEVQHV